MKYKYLTTILIIMFTLALSSLTVLTPDKKTSESENRLLASRPSLSINEGTIDSLLNGSYFTTWDTYFSDQMMGRSTFVNLYTNHQPLLNRQYINDVYFGNEQYLFSLGNYDSKSYAELQQRAAYFNDIERALKKIPLYMVALPSKEMVYENSVGIKNYRAPKISDLYVLVSHLGKEIEVLNLLPTFRNGNEAYYYKTDHHWTMEGTYVGYQEIVKRLAQRFSSIGTPLSKSDFNITTFKQFFLGSEGRKVSQLVADQLEDIELWKSDAQREFTVTVNQQEGQLFEEDKLSTDILNNDYTVYMGGDNAKEVIENPNSKNHLEIVLIGDSMSNPLVGMLAHHVKTVHSFDLRHYEGDILAEIESINPDAVLLVGLSANFTNSGSKVFQVN